MRSFHPLIVWQRAHQVTLAVYRATAGFPPSERYGLTSQLRRAAASIPSNIAEGCGREGPREFAHFLSIACGSASEVEYQLILARDLEYLGGGDFAEITSLVGEVKRMLASLHARMRG